MYIKKVCIAFLFFLNGSFVMEKLKILFQFYNSVKYAHVIINYRYIKDGEGERETGWMDRWKDSQVNRYTVRGMDREHLHGLCEIT